MSVAAALAALATLLTACSAPAQTAPEQPFRAEVRHARVGGERIAYYERGTGPPLLVAIGTGSTMAEWDPRLLRALAAEHRVIVFDYPGVGRSRPRAINRTSFARLADTSAGLLRALGIAQADVLGWSMGGFVAQQLAIRHPGTVRRLILAGTNPGGSRTVLGPPEAQEIDSDPSPDDAAALRVLYPLTGAGQADGRAFLRRVDRASQTGEIPDDFRVPAATVEAQVAAEDPWLRSEANDRALGALNVPTLSAGGTDDPVTPPANARRIAARIPGARLAVLPGAHAFLFSPKFAAEALRFLR